MELRKVSDILLRSQTSPLSSFLNPSSTSRWARGTQLCYRTANNRPVQRTLTHSARNNALKPEATTSASPTSTGGSNAASDSIDELSKSLWAKPSRNPSPSPRMNIETEKRMNGGDSAHDILNAIAQSKFGQSKPKASSTFDTSLMLDPSSPLDNRSLMDSMSQGHLAIPPTPRVPMRLTPSTGRSVTIGTGIDVARGIRLLEQSCARNRIRSDATRQRFHERPGLKRKRLRRQRWRKRFLEGFQATVGRVKQLKNQGW
jgi:small subunit ribosomal protein MRP21